MQTDGGELEDGYRSAGAQFGAMAETSLHRW